MPCMLAGISKRDADCGVTSALTAAEKNEMLEKHNEVRRAEGADLFLLVSIQRASEISQHPGA